ncbi:MAG: hypothetical protein LYZ66_01565, partial [Nitrososphaerales archaeon]|nr:hypothetical protein [Nitrososphaerales archaeon]
MQVTLVERLGPRLRELGSGGYRRVYRGKAGAYETSLRQGIAAILDSLGLRFREHVSVPGTSLTADFETNGTFLFVDRDLGRGDLRQLGKSRSKSVLIKQSSQRSDREDAGVRVIQIGSGRGDREQTIFLDDPSFNFDYAHVLPHTQK